MPRLFDRVEDDVYIVDARLGIDHNASVEHRLARLADLTIDDWTSIRELQGKSASRYLKLRYGAPETRLMLLSDFTGLLALLWVVPGHRIRGKYSFVALKSFAIISCVTRPTARGRGLYPSGIRFIAASGLSDAYYIWAHKSNVASLKGIEKAGGRLIGSFVRERWLKGLYVKLRFKAVVCT